MMGRIYTAGGEKLTPAKEFEKVERMIGIETEKPPEPANAADAESGCIHCQSGEKIPPAYNYCPFCRVKLRR